MNKKTVCDECCYYSYDDEYECHVCDINLDEDEYRRFLYGNTKECPYYRPGDEYLIARKQ